MFSIRRAAAALLVSIIAAGLVAAPASAGTVAPDYQTAVRSIVFPVVGSSTYSDTFGACRSGCTRGHEGTDIMAAKLTRLVAARDATVTWLKDTATPSGSEGNYLMLRDSQGWEYWYIHINNDSPGTDDGANPKQWIFGPGIAKGAKVAAGQLVGYVGDSGNAEGTAPHLHFEIHKPDGTIINPYRSLQAATRLSAPVKAPDEVEQDRAFITALAADFLRRSPTSGEMATGLDRLAAGAGRSAVVADYANSDEWISVLVKGFYRSTLGRDPDADGLQYWIGRLRGGLSAGDAAGYFYASDEYFARSGGTARAWVADLYDEILGRQADAGGLEYWAGLTDSGTPRATGAFHFYRSIESRETRVTALYQQLLGRNPDSGGLGYWAGVLTDGHDVRLATELAGSAEYYSRASRRAR